ncbi:hypothetical protein V8E36_007916 [Tilletia maclaganii]
MASNGSSAAAESNKDSSNGTGSAIQTAAATASAAPAPSLPPRPAQSSSAATAKVTPYATRKLQAPPLAVKSPSAGPPAVGQPPLTSAQKGFEPPPRRPGAPTPGAVSAARGIGSSFHNPTVPAPSPVPVASPAAIMPISRSAFSQGPARATSASLAPFPSASLSSSPSYTMGASNANLPPPPVRRLPAMGHATPVHSPVMTPATLDFGPEVSAASASSSSASLSSLSQATGPRLPLRKQHFPRTSHPPTHPVAIEKHVFTPKHTTTSPAGVTSSTATATLLPPPVRTNRPSPSGSFTSRIAGAPPGLGSLPRNTLIGGPSPSGGTPPRPTAAIVEPAARARYEALFDREWTSQVSKRRKKEAKPTAISLASDDFSFPRSLGNPSPLANRPVLPQPSVYDPLGRHVAGNSRHRAGKSDSAVSLPRGENGSAHSSASSTAASPAKVGTLKGFFEGKTSDTHSSVVPAGMQSTGGTSPFAATSNGSLRPPERKMTKSSTDLGLQVEFDALRLHPSSSALSVNTALGGAVGAAGHRTRAVSASAPGSASDEATSPHALDDRHRLHPSSLRPNQHERERSGGAGSLRSLSSKNLRADATAAACAAAAAAASGSGSGHSDPFSSAPSQSAAPPLSKPRLSPRQTRKIWRRSRLREAFLAKLWEVMGGTADGIEKEPFVRSMAAIDFELSKRSQARARSGREGSNAGSGAGVAGFRGRTPDRG